MTRGRSNKYGAVPKVVDNIRFHSTKEAGRYLELKLLLKAGHIRNLKLQPHYTLMAPVIRGGLENIHAGKFERVSAIGEYHADFSYDELYSTNPLWPKWRFVVEDVKSPATAKKDMYVWKKRHFQRQYGIEIREV